MYCFMGHGKGLPASAMFHEVQKESACVCIVLWDTERVYQHVQCFMRCRRGLLICVLFYGAQKGFTGMCNIS